MPAKIDHFAKRVGGQLQQYLLNENRESMSKEIEIDLNDNVKVLTSVSLDEWQDYEIVEELKERDFDFSKEVSRSELVGALENQDYDFSLKCHKEHFNEDPNSVNLGGNEEIMKRFQKCHNLLNWQQWNHIFCAIEKMSKEERSSQHEKFDYL